MRRSSRRSAHSWVSTPSPQPTSSTDRGRRRARRARRACAWKPAIRRRTTGLVEPYLSKVLPVGTLAACAVAHRRSSSRARSALPVACGGLAPVVRCWPGGVGCPARSARGATPELELHPAHALEDPLLEHPAAGEDVADDAERRELHGDDEQRGAEDQRLDVAAAVAGHEEVGEARPDAHADEAPPAAAAHHEHAQRLVRRVDAEDREPVAADVGPGATGTAATRRVCALVGSARARRPPASCPPG